MVLTTQQYASHWTDTVDSLLERPTGAWTPPGYESGESNAAWAFMEWLGVRGVVEVTRDPALYDRPVAAFTDFARTVLQRDDYPGVWPQHMNLCAVLVVEPSTVAPLPIDAICRSCRQVRPAPPRRRGEPSNQVGRARSSRSRLGPPPGREPAHRCPLPSSAGACWPRPGRGSNTRTVARQECRRTGDVVLRPGRVAHVGTDSAWRSRDSGFVKARKQASAHR